MYINLKKVLVLLSLTLLTSSLALAEGFTSPIPRAGVTGNGSPIDTDGAAKILVEKSYHQFENEAYARLESIVETNNDIEVLKKVDRLEDEYLNGLINLEEFNQALVEIETYGVETKDDAGVTGNGDMQEDAEKILDRI